MKLEIISIFAFIFITSPCAAQYDIRDEGWSLNNDGIRLTAKANFGPVERLARLEISCEPEGFNINVALPPNSNPDTSRKMTSVKVEFKTRDKHFTTGGTMMGDVVITGGAEGFQRKEFLELMRSFYELQSVAIAVRPLHAANTIGNLWFLNPNGNSTVVRYDAANAFGRMSSMCANIIKE